MTPLDVVATSDGDDSDPLLFVELQPPPLPPIPDVGDGDALELPLLLLFRDARLLALALIRRFRSSLSSDLRGETYVRTKRGGIGLETVDR